MFDSTPPCASSEMVHFRKRIGEKGIELIFRESIRPLQNFNNSKNPFL
jgi:IS5 family transposase